MGSRSVKELYLLDTCAWIWIVTGHIRITPKIQKILNQADWLLSAISVWEVAVLESKKKIELNRSIERWIDAALVKVPGLILAPLSPDISIKSCYLQDYKYSDPADRIIIATAMRYEASIVTADTKITEYCKVQQLPVIKV